MDISVSMPPEAGEEARKSEIVVEEVPTNIGGRGG